jgi:hypothetical protein
MYVGHEVLPDRTLLVCAYCNATFNHATQLGKHFNKYQKCHAEWQSVQLRQNPTVNRVRMTVDQKCNLLEELKDLEAKNTPLAQTVLAILHPRIGGKNISLWNKLRGKIFEARAH